jgi:nucleotide-binding universal stress UspA family protein
MEAATNDTGPVVVGIDGSEASMVALRHAAREAGWRGVEVHVVHALDVTPAVLHLANNRTINTRELAESDREEIWRLAMPILDDSVAAVVEVNRDGKPGSALVEYSREIGASVLVVAPRGRGRVVDALLGSTAQSVVRDAQCDVLVVKSS